MRCFQCSDSQKYFKHLYINISVQKRKTKKLPPENWLLKTCGRSAPGAQRSGMRFSALLPLGAFSQVLKKSLTLVSVTQFEVVGKKLLIFVSIV